MKIFQYPNGDLLVPKRAEEGSLLGDGMVRLTKQDPEYTRWIAWFKKTGNRPKKINTKEKS